MQKLLSSIKNLKKGKIKQTIDSRINQFKELGKKSSNELFNELCFCLMTANFNAERSIKIQNEIGDGFLTLSKNKLAEKLKLLSHRFPNKRAEFIFEARKHKENLKKILGLFNNKKFNKDELREWLIENIKGLGYKEASHFLRNIGFEDFAIIDFHIIDILEKNNLIKKPKTITKKNYLEIERLLKQIAEKSDLNLAELDLYLWYCETGKVLK